MEKRRKEEGKKEKIMKDKISLLKLALTDNIDNPNFEANRKYALKILNELSEAIRDYT